MVLKIVLYSVAYLVSTFLFGVLAYHLDNKTDTTDASFMVGCLLWPLFCIFVFPVVLYYKAFESGIPYVVNRIKNYRNARQRLAVAKRELKELGIK